MYWIEINMLFIVIIEKIKNNIHSLKCVSFKTGSFHKLYQNIPEDHVFLAERRKIQL